MHKKISAVINTRNEEANIVRCIRSVVPYVDEVVVVDMESTDDTVKLAHQYTSRIFKHKNTDYVEPARNYAISKAQGEWILLVDADEVIPDTLGLKLRKLTEGEYSYFGIPRKNFIFGTWIQHSGWWPDYQIRFFEKNAVSWNDEIHSIPVTTGKGIDLPATEAEAFMHHHYVTIEQYIERLNRYSTQEVRQLLRDGVHFEWKNLIAKPTNEFLSRFFAWEGYKDGVHGLALALLQAFSFLVVQLKLWEQQKFETHTPQNFLDESNEVLKRSYNDITYWYQTTKYQEAEGVSKTLAKIRSKIKL
ncbi:TPA: glycosyltransferase family 2 protein [Patescibacteria group bacterium]|uniref:Glycosyl transferase family 2 n=1 Tax=Candidatus Gottesmanbacteria bacterium GW2011_GWA1_43_11 TaxID=1618436 RepID=A0A0G1FG94_9BACT|nr:MAG: Glycosyl transferase family 2 [Candidatus Gottesmanbacteria bacterium GW2011_GWA1_43_11]HCS78150.1 glycosyltransferase family 2 protein [Patescibacteria group bacterium]